VADKKEHLDLFFEMLFDLIQFGNSYINLFARMAIQQAPLQFRIHRKFHPSNCQQNIPNMP